MKHALSIALLALSGALLISSQATAATGSFNTDTVKNKVKLPGDTLIIEDVQTGEKRKIKIHLPGEENGLITIERSAQQFKMDTTEKRTSTKSRSHKDDKKVGRPIFGITFSRIDFGLTKPMQGGSFSLDGANEKFDYRPSKTANFGFDVLQAGYRFNREFRVFMSAGFDWTYIRLQNDLIFDSENSPYTTQQVDGGDLTKNRLTSTYLRLPLTFEFRPGGDKMRLAVGPMAGFLLKGTQRYKEDGKKIKTKGDFGYAPFQYGMFARFGVGGIGIYGKYYFNDMFENSPANAGLQNFTFGLSVGF